MAGLAGFIVAVWYSVFIRFYQSAGGMIGVTEPMTAGFRWASYTAGLMILVGAAACLYLTQPGLRAMPAWSAIRPGAEVPRVVSVICCAIPTSVAAIVAVGHGAGGGLAKALEAAGIGVASIHGGAAATSAAGLAWELLVYEPWFVLFGLFLGWSVIGFLRQSGVHAATVTRVRVALILGCVAYSVVVLLAMLRHWNLSF